MFKIFKNPIFKQIFYFNLLYANPTITSNAMKKKKYGESPENVFRGLLIKSYILSSVFILLIYTGVFLALPLDKVPYFMDYTIVLFFLLSVLQTFTYFFNVFYSSKDLEGYMCLPIEEGLVYRAKMMVVSIATIQMAIPIWPIASIYGYNMGLGAMSIVYGFMDFVLVGCLVVLVNMVLMEGLAKTSILSKFKNGIITAINIVATISNVGLILYFQNASRSHMNVLAQKSSPIRYGPISSICKTNIGNLVLIVAMALVIGIVYWLIIRRVDGRFYDYIRKIQGGNHTRKVKQEKNKDQEVGQYKIDSVVEPVMGMESRSLDDIGIQRKSRKSGLGKSLFKYNISLINDPTVITQSIIMGAIFPIIMLAPTLINSRESAEMLEMIRTNKGMVSAAIAIILAIMPNIYATSLPSIIASLDRENFNYIKSLPISRRDYFMSKLYFATGINSIIPVVLMLVFFVYAGIGILDTVFALVLYGVLTLSIAALWLKFDFEHIVTDWQNVTDLYGRLNKAVMFVFTLFLFLICFSIVAVLFFVASMGFGSGVRYLLAGLVFIIAIVSLLVTSKFLRKNNY